MPLLHPDPAAFPLNLSELIAAAQQENNEQNRRGHTHHPQKYVADCSFFLIHQTLLSSAEQAGCQQVQQKAAAPGMNAALWFRQLKRRYSTIENTSR